MRSRYLLLLTLACSSPNATIAVTTGGESDALTRAPAVTTVLVEAVDRSGGRVTLAQATLPGGTIDLGNPSQTDVASIQLTGSGAGSTGALVWGAVPFAELGVFNGQTIPLFVQRKNELARMPGTFDGRAAPLLATTPRGIYMAGGTETGSTTTPPIAGYDLVNLAGANTTVIGQPNVTSFALVELTQATADGDLALAWLFDSKGVVTPVGLATSIAYPPPVPTTFSWSDVVGGATVMGDDGSAYVVGGSRSSAPSTVVVMLPPSNGNKSGTTQPRQGAAVAWAPNRGVFIYGGNVDTTHAGAEIVNSGATSQSLNFASDATQGLAAVAFDANTMLLAGDAAQPRTVDLTCSNTSAACPVVPWGVTLPMALTSPSLFAVGKATFVIVGDDASGATHVFRLDATSTTELTLKIPRQQARATQIETGQVVIVGGGSPVLESYVP
jgi:hypothetical protein